MILHDYFRSSAAYRVRIALELKGLTIEHRAIRLLENEQQKRWYLEKNPQGLVPVLELDDGTMLSQSLAIIEYLDALRPEPRLIPVKPVLAAKVRAFALSIACEIHPLTNLRVLKYLESNFKTDQATTEEWRRQWIDRGLHALEAMIEPGPFCYGTTITLADVCLIPQLYSARRYETPLEAFPKLRSVETACVALSSFRNAHPSRQADAPLPRNDEGTASH